MMKSRLHFKCWERGHDVYVSVSKQRVSDFLQKCKLLMKVCPECKPENKHLVLVSDSLDKFTNAKAYRCKHNHITLIKTFGRSAHKLEITWGPNDSNRNNIDANVEDLMNLIQSKQIKCSHYKKNSKLCECKLLECDDSKLEYYEFSNFKTKTRVDDVWKKYKVPEPVQGDYDVNSSDSQNPFLPKYNASEFEKRNKERLKKMQRSRNIKTNKLPGKPLK